MVFYQNDNYSMESLSGGVPSYQLPFTVWFMVSGSSGYSTDLEVDWVRVRRFVDPEPVCVVGVEEMPAPLVGNPVPVDLAVNVVLNPVLSVVSAVCKLAGRVVVVVTGWHVRAVCIPNNRVYPTRATAAGIFLLIQTSCCYAP